MSRTKILIPSGHSAKQRLIMNALSMPYLSELFVSCGTKFGKSFGAAGGFVTKSLITPNEMGRWVAPIYSQAKIGFKYCKKFLPPEPHTKIDNSDLTIELLKIKTELEFKSGKFPEDLEGERVGVGYILDEAAKMKQEVYSSARTTVTQTRAPIVAISTPRGKNWFYTKCMEAKEEMEFCLRNHREPTRLFITARTIDNPFISPEAVLDAKRSLPDRLFRQYYLAEFIDDGAVFAGYRDIIKGPELIFDGASQYWIDPDYQGGTVVVGADWAKIKDYTVFTAIDVVTRKLVGFWRFHKTKYTEAIRKLVLFCSKFADVLVVRHDKTGLGNVIDDQLAYTNLPFEGITFTNPIKAEMVGQLITAIEQQMILFPNWSHLIDELESYEVHTNLIGTMSYGAVSGKHDDIVSSLLLSHTALLQYSDSGFEVKFLEDLNKPQKKTGDGKTLAVESISPIERFYQSFNEDNDD